MKRARLRSCLWLALPLVAAWPCAAAPTEVFTGSGLFAGVYFGTFEEGEGHWAMCVSWKGEPTFDFIGRPSGGAAPLIRSYPYAADFYSNGQFHGATPDIEGTIVLGRVTGSTGSQRFVGSVDRVESPAAIYAGYWQWAPSPPFPAVEVIAGPSGQALVAYRKSPSEGEDALTRVDANGELAVTVSQGTRVNCRIDVGARRLVVALGSDPLPAAPAAGEGQIVNFSVLSPLSAASAWNLQQFSVAADDLKNVLLRAVGPGLAAVGRNDALANPAYEVWDDDGLRYAASDDWKARDPGLLDAMQRVGALPLEAGSRDAAQVAGLVAGNYTMVTHSQETGGTGVVLSEVFDLDSPTGALHKLTARGRVEGDDSLVTGFVIADDKPALVLVRAIGPKLADFGVRDALADPQLKITTAAGVSVAQNDNWDPLDAVLVAAMRRAGGIGFREPSKDAAVLVSLPPGAYVASVRGADHASGTTQIEITRPRLSRAGEAALAVDVFKVERTQYQASYTYEPELQVFGTDAAGPVVIRQVRFNLLAGTGSRIPEWRSSNVTPAKTVNPGALVDLFPLVYGEREFSFGGSMEASLVAVTIIFSGPDQVEHSISALTQVVPREAPRAQ